MAKSYVRQPEEQTFLKQTEQESELEIKNKHDGYSFAIDNLKEFRRLLIIGEKSEDESMKKIRDCVNKLINDERVKDAVKIIEEISEDNCAPHKVFQIMALAVCATWDPQDKSQDKLRLSINYLAYNSLPKVCTNPSDLLEFIHFCQQCCRERNQCTGWGRMHKRFIGKWYIDLAKKDPMKLLYRILKFKRRRGWSHKDVFKKCHLKTELDEMKFLITYCIAGYQKVKSEYENKQGIFPKMLKFLAVCYELSHPHQFKLTDETVCEMIGKYKLHFLHLSCTYYSMESIWVKFLETISIRSLLRNLGRITRRDVFDNENAINIIDRKFKSESLSNIHPWQVIIALQTYSNGYGFHGKLTWSPNEKVCDILKDACIATFKHGQCTSKEILIAVDISTHDDEIGKFQGYTVSQAAAAFTWVMVNIEPNCKVISFTDRCFHLDISSKTSLSDVEKKLAVPHSKRKDCSLPIKYALETHLDVDIFVIMTDSETYAGSIKPHQAFKEYEKERPGKNIVMYVIGMTNNNVSISDPKVFPCMFDIPVFDNNMFGFIKKFSIDLTNYEESTS